MKSRNKNFLIGFLIFLSSIFLIASTLLYFLTDWFSATFNATIRVLLYTVKSPLKGADTHFLQNAVRYCARYETFVILALVAFYFFAVKICGSLNAKMLVELKSKKFNKKTFSLDLKFILIFALTIFSVIFAFYSLNRTDSKIKFREYRAQLKAQTRIYEDFYVNPKTARIVSPEKKKNLIYIYMESMETTYASVAEGGKQSEINYIPHLTQLAKENISFSDKIKGSAGTLGGFHSCAGWTLGALFATSTGVPFSFPVGGNDMGSRSTFASGITALGDILKTEGYTQEFLCGSDGNFAGRKDFFEQHGEYFVFDLFTAKEKGYIAPDYAVWWGFEDEILYKIARDEVTRLAKEGEPFNFTMLTVDTHHVGGYFCNLCKDEYPENLANVVSCADRQLFDFISWLNEQDFFDDTVIVITGDHPRMDNILINDTPYYDRTVYNCFINAQKTPVKEIQGRNFTTVDMFPTVISAMGFTLPQNRLGLGVDLFSAEETLPERIGWDEFSVEISKYSKFYIDNFS